jgi:RHS repeat-associated protein
LSGTIRNNYSGWVGNQISVGTSPLVVTDLGRWVKSGNSGIHTVKLVRAADGIDVPGGSVSVNTSGATAGQYKYVTLANPVVLEASTTYYLMSQEANGGDLWYDGNTTLTASSGFTIPGNVTGTAAPYTAGGSANNGYVPIGFKSSSGTWNVAKETHYVYDGMLVVQERDGSNNPTVSYTRGKDLSGGRQGAGGIGGLLAYTSTGTGDHYYHSDALGNVTAMMNVTNVLSASYEYDPYGNLLGAAGPMAGINNYRFSSKELHQNSGLYAYGYRFYEPSFQRWVNRDPIGIKGGVNLYGFVQNRPNRTIDLLGLEASKETDPVEYIDPAEETREENREAMRELSEEEAAMQRAGQMARAAQQAQEAEQAAMSAAEAAARAAKLLPSQPTNIGANAPPALPPMIVSCPSATPSPPPQVQYLFGPSTAPGLRTACQAGISPSNALRIQNAADRTGQQIIVVGSRASGTSGQNSDWDYIMSGSSAARHSAASSVPAGSAGGAISASGAESGIDIGQTYNPNAPNYTPLNPNLPHVIFSPN